MGMMGVGIWQRDKISQIDSRIDKAILTIAGPTTRVFMEVGAAFCAGMAFILADTALDRNREGFADKNALKYVSTLEKVKGIVTFTYFQKKGHGLGGMLSTHPSHKKRIEWIRESIGRENLFLRVYAKVLLGFFMTALRIKLFFENASCLRPAGRAVAP